METKQSALNITLAGSEIHLAVDDNQGRTVEHILHNDYNLTESEIIKFTRLFNDINKLLNRDTVPLPAYVELLEKYVCSQQDLAKAKQEAVSAHSNIVDMLLTAMEQRGTTPYYAIRGD
jgi:hypothetical protein